jgi:hypothetical protein
VVSATIADVESHDVNSNEWHEALSMNLNQNALSTRVLAGLPNAEGYSYVSRIQETHHGTSSYLPPPLPGY